VLFLLFLLFSFVTWIVVTQPLPPGRGAASTVVVDPARLETHVRALSETCLPRDAAHPEGLDRAAAYIREAFEQTGGRVSEQVYQIGDSAYRNVIVQFGPETGERIVGGAHYDTAGALPGADDNASGVAGLIELARTLDGTSLPAPVELVAYTLEEPPYFGTDWMGSAVHARALVKGSIAVRLMISLEMIGYFSDDAHSQRFPLPFLRLFYPDRGDFIGIVGKLDGALDVRRIKKVMRRATALPVYSFNAPPGSIVGLTLSDHLSYWRNGYRAIMITDTAFLRNSNYHSAGDTADKLDYARMAMVVVGVYEAVLDAAL